MKTYRTGKYSIDIKEYELVKETKSQVVYLEKMWNDDEMYVERKSNKKTDWHQYFSTYNEAKDYLINREKKKIEYHELMIETTKNNLHILEKDNKDKQ